VTGGLPVGSLGLFMRFIGVLLALIGVIGSFEAPGPILRRGVSRRPLVGCFQRFVSVTSGLLLEEVGYPLGVRWARRIRAVSSASGYPVARIRSTARSRS
jgi:hypothetical protein